MLIYSYRFKLVKFTVYYYVKIHNVILINRIMTIYATAPYVNSVDTISLLEIPCLRHEPNLFAV